MTGARSPGDPPLLEALAEPTAVDAPPREGAALPLAEPPRAAGRDTLPGVGAAPRSAVEIATPTAVEPPRVPAAPSGLDRGGGAGALPEGDPAAPVAVLPPALASEPIRVISMKLPGHDETPVPGRGDGARPVPAPRIRPLAEVRRHAATPPGGLGYLAPPRDPRAARARQRRDYAVWGGLAVILASAVTVAIWALAGS